MNRDDKIKLLNAIQEGKVNIKKIKPLPGMDLRANTDVFSDVLLSEYEYPFYLVKSYECNITGQVFDFNQIARLIEEREEYTVGVLPIVEKKENKLFAIGIVFRKISKDDQIRLQLQSFENSNRSASYRQRL